MISKISKIFENFDSHVRFKATNMKCLTPEQTMSGNCEFLAANLYAKSMFGESALANLSIEVGKQGYVLGIEAF